MHGSPATKHSLAGTVNSSSLLLYLSLLFILLTTTLAHRMGALFVR